MSPPDKSAKERSLQYRVTKATEALATQGERLVAANEALAPHTESQTRFLKSQLKATWWQFGGLVFTLVFTAIAALSAADAAKSARDAVTLERAWLTTSDVSITPTLAFERKGGTHAQVIALHAQWRNSGRTPALQAAVWMEGGVYPIDADLPTFRHDWTEGDGNAVVGPEMNYQSAEALIGGPNLADVIANRKKIIVYSAARYRDIFQQNIWRFSEGYFEIVATGVETNEHGDTRPTFAIKSVGPQNTAS